MNLVEDKNDGKGRKNTHTQFNYSRSMSLSFVAVLCLAIVQHRCLCDAKTKENRDPIVEFLQLDPHSQHELVDIRIVDRLHKRASTGNSQAAGRHIKIRVFGSDVDLWLYPRDSILFTESTPVYYSMFDPRKSGKVNVQLQPGLMRKLGEIFEDPVYLASIVIGKDQQGRTTFNGRIGALNVGVRSLPGRVVDEYVELRRDARHSEDNVSATSYHVVYRIRGDYGNYLLTENDKMSLRRGLPSNAIPHILYPKLLIAVDYSLFKSQKNDIYAYLEYLMAFANGIDLNYRALESPSFRFHIAAILIATDDGGLPFISDEMVSEDAFESFNSMIAAKGFFYRIRNAIPLSTYDLTITLTKYSFGLEESEVMGKAWVGVTCRNSQEYEVVEPIAICKDDNSFLGVQVASHELGHTFGLRHDPTNVDDCQYSNGFIMSFAPHYTRNSSTFSSCSLDQFQKQIDKRNYECMYQPPVISGKKLPKLLPGRVRSLEEQCESFGLGAPCNTTDPDICVNVRCADAGNECYKSGTAALSGTPCGDPNDIFERYCVQNRCVRV